MNFEHRNYATHGIDLNGKSVLVTGCTGSFGNAFVQMVLERFTPERLIVYSRDELKQHEMQTRYDPKKHRYLRFFIGDVRDRDRLTLAMRRVDYVIHAAALKQVPAAEYNPMECLRTNVIGAENVVRCAIDNGVKRTIALSTDKAANPINLYGATKLVSDKVFIAGNNLSGTPEISFSVVRYGNVIGSRGSVVPFFQRLAAEGAEYLPITDDRMTRFWITLRQGVEFVLSSMAMMRGGEIFVPKIPSMTITDIAKSIAPGLPLKVTGIRPGEKLHETMIPEDEARNTIDLGDRYLILPSFNLREGDEAHYAKAKRMPDGFSYRSDNNPEWMTAEELRKILEVRRP